MAEHGDHLEELEVQGVCVVVRFGCVRRDIYELTTASRFPSALRETLGAHGTLKGTPALYVVDVPGVHQITIASERGRAVIMPRFSQPREAQRAAALQIASLIAALGTIEPSSTP